MSDGAGRSPSRPAPGAGRRSRPDGAGLAVAGALAALAALLLVDAARLPAAGGYSGVGPASVPRAIAAALLGLALWTAALAWRGPGGLALGRAGPAQAPGRALWVVAGLLAQILLLRAAGFSIATGLLFAFTARAFGFRALWASVPIGIALSLAVYGVFALALDLRLPAAALERLAYGG